MRAAPAFDLFTIGHSNIPIDRFVALLQQAEVTAVADVRSVPASRRFPWFSKSNLAKRLAGEGIDYTLMGDMLGGRPRDARLYRNGVADYEAMASEPHYLEGLARLTAQAQCSRICLMCAEREPLECHRCLLVARSLAEGGFMIGHILHDGRVEPHAETDRRLLALTGEGCDLFTPGQRERLAAAYRRQAYAVAYRRPANNAKRTLAAESR
ncbi:MAG: DUF488 domain-containing protein [Xanthobacteraceae bacterium]